MLIKERESDQEGYVSKRDITEQELFKNTHFAPLTPP